MTNRGANVNVGGHSFAPLPLTATNAQRLAQATVINTETTNNVTRFDDDVHKTLNQVARAGSGAADVIGKIGGGR